MPGASRRNKKEACHPESTTLTLSKPAAPTPVPVVVVVPVQSPSASPAQSNAPGSSENEFDNQAQSQPENPHVNDVQELPPNETNEGAENSRNQEEVEEEPLFERFPGFIRTHRKTDEKKKIKVEKEVSVYRSKTEHPLRAELFNSVMSYVKNDIRRMKEFYPDITENEFEGLARTRNNLSSSANVKHQVVKLVKYSLEQYSQRYLHNLICNLQLKHCVNKRESLWWSGYEMKINSNDPSHEFREEPSEDQLILSAEEYSAVRKNVRAKAKRAVNSLTTDNGSKMVTQVMSWEHFIVVAVLEIKTKHIKIRGKRVEKNSYSSAYGAFNPKLPYLFIYGKIVSHKLILALVESAGDQYRTYVNLNLKDIGLGTLYSSCLKISTAHYTERVEQLLMEGNEDSANENIPTLTGFEQPEKRRKMMKALIDDKQEGGFKTLTLQISQSNPASQQIPVTIKFRARQKGNLNEMVADMYGNGSWKDPTSYLMARDKKSNRLKLKYEPGRGYVEDSGSGIVDEPADLSE